jgi:large subunit ribosomal protein L36
LILNAPFLLMPSAMFRHHHHRLHLQKSTSTTIPNSSSHHNPPNTETMIPSLSLLRTARVLFPTFRTATTLLSRSVPTSSRTITQLTTTSQCLRRPTILATQAQKGVQEQVRGMKVRSSVKKLCEGCKVCFCGSFPCGGCLAFGWGLVWGGPLRVGKHEYDL